MPQIETLYPQVTEAIRRAEALEAADAEKAAIAYRDVSFLEEQIAGLFGPAEPEGAIARRGAVRAAISSGDFARAKELVAKFSIEVGLNEELRSDLEQLVNSLPEDEISTYNRESKQLKASRTLDILIVDDEADIRELVSGILQDEGFITRSARDSDDALAHVASRRPSLVFLDIWLQGSRLDGLQLLDAMKAQHPELPIVMISGHGNIETAIAAIKQGAYDFIEKPFKADRLVLVAQRALETSRLKREVKALKQLALSTLVGKSSSMNQLRQTIEKIAPTNSRILIVGPAGAGKELAARAVHSHSARANGPFIVINAAAMMPERMEIELFGVEPSVDGQERKVGALEESHGGTLFIDEIADMSRETQNKILRVLVEQSFQRVGGTQKVQVDVRIISSTGRNIEAEIAAGKFREDLYHRLSVVPIRVPPLAERREDIPLLIQYFMEQISMATGLPKRLIGEDAMAVLQSHDWPGNVRQLRNNVERLMILAGGDPEAVINADMLPQDVGSMVPSMPGGDGGEHLMGLPLRDAREVFEREYLVAQISRFGGNISRTAEFVGMERSALHRKLKALGID
jgi:two-component system nitrogen regulation response regulator NtrX